MKRRFTITTLGCKVNQSESEALSRCLEARGWVRVGREEPADLCIINSCAVTGRAAMQSRQEVRAAGRAHPGAQLVVTGCYAQVDAEALRKIEDVTCIAGHSEKFALPDIIQSAFDSGTAMPGQIRGDILRERRFLSFPEIARGKRTRPFLKIQDGCNSFCSYCIVPYARGPSRSMPVNAVMENISAFARAGFRELVISGIHVGAYGRDLEPETDFCSLLRRIDAEGEIDRIRVSSIEPGELTDDIIGLVAGSRRFCRHFHIPLQSGDNEILKRMGRPYRTEDFAGLVRCIADRIPDAAVGVDVMIGFPGETEDAFSRTFALIESLPVAYLHVFPFSPREGTRAARFPDPVPSAIAKERAGRMRALGEEKRRRFYAGFAGKTAEVLVESQRDRKTGLLKGVSSNYLTVLFAGDDDLKNRLVRVRLEGNPVGTGIPARGAVLNGKG